MTRAAGGDMVVFSCSHCRTVVRLDDGWHHIDGYDGGVLGVCEASVFRHAEGDENRHALVNVVNYDNVREFSESVEQRRARCTSRHTAHGSARRERAPDGEETP